MSDTLYRALDKIVRLAAETPPQMVEVDAERRIEIIRTAVEAMALYHEKQGAKK